MKYNRALPLVVPIIIWLLLEFYLFNTKLIYWLGALSILIIFFTARRFCRESLIDKNWWNFSILPIIFLIAVIFYSTMLQNALTIQVIFALVLIFLYFYLRFSYYYLIRPVSYKVASIENISSYVNLISVFLFSASIYGLEAFLNFPVWPLMLVLAIFSGLAIYQIFWTSKIELKASLIYVIICPLVIIELAWALSFLPLNYNVSGLILAICYYVLIGLTKLKLLDMLDMPKVKLYLYFGLISILVVLLTSRWL